MLAQAPPPNTTDELPVVFGGGWVGAGSHYNDHMNSLLFRAHAVQRMFERGVSVGKVREALKAEDVIEDYTFEMPEPSRLLFGMQGRRPFHVVTSENTKHITIITVYLPSPDKWKKDSRSRR